MCTRQNLLELYAIVFLAKILVNQKQNQIDQRKILETIIFVK